MIDGYTIPYAALMLLFAVIGDKYSRRGALVLGLVLFGGGAIWAAERYGVHSSTAGPKSSPPVP